MRIAIERMIESLGFKTVTASNGEEAWRSFSKHGPVVTFLDIAMPGIDGIEALRRIRMIDPEAVVVMLTASSDQQTVLLAVEAGASDFITKPATVARLKDAMERLVPAA